LTPRAHGETASPRWPFAYGEVTCRTLMTACVCPSPLPTFRHSTVSSAAAEDRDGRRRCRPNSPARPAGSEVMPSCTRHHHR
jgi:hypothetical protein